MAGLDFDIAPNLKLELSYRYLNLGAIAVGGRIAPPARSRLRRAASSPRRRAGALASNDVRIGLVWLVGDPDPAGAGLPPGRD